MANKVKFNPGQHFVLDQEASKIIKMNKIKTIIIGSDVLNLGKVICNKKYLGTIISD